METDFLVSLLLGALIGGAIVAAIALRRFDKATERVRDLQWSACHWATAYAEELAKAQYLRRVNQELGRALESAGVPVQRIGECDCDDCAEEWPTELHEMNQ